MSNYYRSVSAALSETASKFALAEALALDIPEQQGKAGVSEALEQVRQEIIDAGGEPRSVITLKYYRLAGLWATSTVNGTSEWVEGMSFTSHSEARAAGISFADFKANPKTVREIRQENGAASKDGAPAAVIAGWSPEQKAEARDQLRKEAVESIANENEARRVATTPKETAKPAPKAGTEAGQQKRAIELAMAEVMHFSRDTIRRADNMAVQFTDAMPNPWWNKQVPGSTMYRTHEEQVLGDLDKAAEAIQLARVTIAKAIDKAQATV